MKQFRHSLMGAALLAAPFAWAEATLWPGEAYDVYILGEVHDNPAHHRVQTRFITEIIPSAVVFEMLTPEEAAALQDVPRDPAAMLQAIAGFRWSNIEDYSEVLAASPIIKGAALPRDDVRAAFSDGAAAVFGSGADRFGLADALPESEADQRAQMQFDAHCEAMPMEMMGGMIEAQRLRDAAFARSVIAAVEAYGSGVVLITGNGHARKDWGVPVYLRAARPDLTVFSLGQSEANAVGGEFDTVVDAAPVERPDPCAAFR